VGETRFIAGAEGATRPESLRQKDRRRKHTSTLESGRFQPAHRRGLKTLRSPDRGAMA